MAKEGWPFLLPLVALGLGALWLQWFVALGLLGFLAAFVAFFFRDPERDIPSDPKAIVSPADGRIIRLEARDGNQALSIFLSPLDVHINRAPIEGLISKREHRKGRFRAAYDERASVENERLDLSIQGREELKFALIAGVLARRIKVWKKAGDYVSKGDRIGLIRFGSRVDLLLPPGCTVAVGKGDRVKGGSSVLAYWDEA